ncbi:MAG: LEPR-XLL domain-containing protein, partial [Thermoguttaceae bacterium]
MRRWLASWNDSLLRMGFFASKRRKPARLQSQQPRSEALEPRMLLSADLGAMATYSICGHHTAEYAETGGNWQTVVVPVAYEGDVRSHAANDGQDSATATWSFDNLDQSKTYQVYATWQPASTQADNAPFSILDNDGHVLATFLANEQFAPVNATFDGTTWESLGAYRFTTGRALVRLSDQADGVVVADAVTLVEVPPVVVAPEIVDNGDAAFKEKGSGWLGTDSTSAFGGDYRYHAAGDGQATATWTFAALDPTQQYDVLATWPAGPGLATNAPFSVLSGGKVLGAAELNEQVAPASTEADGAGWQVIGSFQPKNGRLVVELLDDANGTVAADAVRVVDALPTITVSDFQPLTDEGCYNAFLINSNQPSHSVTVPYEMSGTDLPLFSGSVLVATVACSLNVPAMQEDSDWIYEGPETVTVTLSSSSAYILGNSQATATVVNDNPPPVWVLPGTSPISEDSATGAQFTIYRNPSSNELTVAYWLSGPVYSPIPQSGGSLWVEIPPNSNSATVTVLPSEDLMNGEGSEQITLSICSSAMLYSLSSPSSATVTVIDDNDCAMFTDADNDRVDGSMNTQEALEIALKDVKPAKYIAVDTDGAWNSARQYVPLDVSTDNDTETGGEHLCSSIQIEFTSDVNPSPLKLWTSAGASVPLGSPMPLSAVGLPSLTTLYVQDTQAGFQHLNMWTSSDGTHWAFDDQVAFTALDSHVPTSCCGGGTTTSPTGQPVTDQSFVPGGGSVSNTTGDGQDTQIGANPRLVLCGNALAVVQGDEVAIWDFISGQLVPRTQDQGTLVAGGISPATYTWTDPDGTQWGFDTSESLETNAGHLVNKTPVGGPTTAYSYDANGDLSQATVNLGNGNQQIDSYSTANGVVTETVTNQQGSTPTTVGSAQYNYYQANDPNGNPGDLETVSTYAAAGSPIETTYYRYYTAGQQNGYSDAYKMIFDGAEFAAMQAAGINPYTAADSVVQPYASEYYQYDSNGRVTKEITAGTGDSLSTGQGEIDYQYTFSSYTDAPNNWYCKTVETLADQSTVTTFTNSDGEEMLRDVASGTQHWITYNQYDANDNDILTAEPSAVSSYDTSQNPAASLNVVLKSSQGLIDVNQYYTSTTAPQYPSSGNPSSGGGVTGYLWRSGVQQGSSGSPVWQSATDYVSDTLNGITVYYPYDQTQYPNANGSNPETTTAQYTFFSLGGNVVGPTVATETTVLPVVSTAQHGSGVANTSTDVFDTFGDTVWSKDAAGYSTYTQYDPLTRAVVKTITDANLSVTSDFTTADLALISGLGWSTPAGGGKRLITSYQVDSQGRTIEETDPAGEVTYTVYNDAAHEVRTYPGWNATTDQTTGPVQDSREDMAGNYTETLTYVWTGSGGLPVNAQGQPTGAESLTDPNTVIQSLSRSLMNPAGQVTQSLEYTSLPSSGYSTSRTLGAKGTNYLETDTYFDSLGRAAATYEPSGTIDHTFFDTNGNVVAEWQGTCDIPTA